METIKWISLLGIIILSKMLGNIQSKKYKNRLKELKDLKVTLNMIETKIRYTYMPLREIFSSINIAQKQSKIDNLIERVSEKLEIKPMEEAWIEGVKEQDLSLNDEDLDIVLNIGKILGKTDTDGQVSEIKVVQNFLDKQIEKAEDEKSKNEKLYKSLGAIAGITIAIILV